MNMINIAEIANSTMMFSDFLFITCLNYHDVENRVTQTGLFLMTCTYGHSCTGRREEEN